MDHHSSAERQASVSSATDALSAFHSSVPVVLSWPSVCMGMPPRVALSALGSSTSNT